MEQTIVLREATDADLHVCAQFWLAMFEEVGILRESDFPPDWRERYVAYFARRMAANEARMFLAVAGDRIVGTAGAMLADGYPVVIHGLRFGYIFSVRVEPDMRKRGLATTLTRNAIEWLQSQQCRRIRLHASPFGRPIYERLGFAPTNEMQLRA